jgi:molecular chaperone GrpE
MARTTARNVEPPAAAPKQCLTVPARKTVRRWIMSDFNTNPEAASDIALDNAAKVLEAEIVEQKDRYLRLAADFDNYRKRLAQEIERRAAAQKEEFIRELLPVIDNLERALATDASTSPEQLRQGVQLTLQQLHQLLRRHGIEPQESLGRPFDPHWHEAVAARREPGQPDHAVLEVYQRGYQQGDVVFRPAKVVVNDLSRPEAVGHAG